jgi:protein ImuB
MSRTRVAVVALSRDDDRELHRLAQVLHAVTPMIEIIDAQALLLPMRGPTRYFGGERAVVERIVALAESVGVRDVRVGVGSSRLAARVAADRGDVCIVPAPQHRDFLGALPVSVLQTHAHVDPEVVSLLLRLGLGTLGAVSGVERSMLADRFGPDGDDVHVLATGDDLHPVCTEPLPTQCFVESHHDTPLGDVTAVLFAATRLADEMVDRLAPGGLVVCRVIVVFTTEHDESCSRVWYHPHGFTAAMLTERLRWQVEKWIEGGLTAGVTHVSIDVQAAEARRATQLGLWGEHGEADRAAWAAVARLVAVAGDAVRVPEWRGGRDPMHQFALVPAGRVEIRDPAAARQRVTPGEVHPRAWSGELVGIVPTVPVEPCRAVEVVDDDGRRVVVTGRHMFSSQPCFIVDGVRRHRVVACFGPWPVEERWWDAARRRRMARVQCLVDIDDRQTAWLLVSENRSWWLVGTYG